MGSELAALSGSGLKLVDLEKETEPQPSCRRRYHCWLSRPLPMPRPKGFELKRLLVHKDLGEEVTQGDSIVLDIMKFRTTVIRDVQISSALIPLYGAPLRPSLRKHFVKAAVEVAFGWMQTLFPLKSAKILLPELDITKDEQVFAKLKEKLTSDFYVKDYVTCEALFLYD